MPQLLSLEIVLFATGPIALVMFPKATVMHNSNNNGRELLQKSLLYIGSISLLIIAVFTIAPEFIVRMLFGSRYTGINDRHHLFCSCPCSHFADKRCCFLWPCNTKVQFLYVLGMISVLEVVLISLYHDSSLIVVQILTALMAVLFISVCSAKRDKE